MSEGKDISASSGPPAVPAAPPEKGEPSGISRRLFLWSLPVGWTAFAAACTSGEVDVRWKDAFGVWIVRVPDGFYALISVCTHLGCSPNWLPAENKFKCPCHGSGFYMTGVNFEGPAPRPLERARIVLADDGQILVVKSVKFQQEKGEWD